MIGIDSTLLARVGDDLGGGREVGAGVGRRIQELNRDLVVDGLVGGRRCCRRDAGGVFIELLAILVTRPRKIVSGKASNCTTRRVAELDVRDVGLVDLDLGLEHAHVADREQRRGVLVQRALDRGFALARPTRRVILPGHGGANGRLAERALVVAQRGRGLVDLVTALPRSWPWPTSSAVRSCSSCSSEIELRVRSS